MQIREVKVRRLSSATVHFPDKLVVRRLTIYLNNVISCPPSFRSRFRVCEVKVFECFDYWGSIILEMAVRKNIIGIGTEQFSRFANCRWPISR
jgi:hypothetical protein